MINKQLGNIGESLAVKYLKEQGFKNIKSNVRNKIGEIDIIAYDKQTLVFFEVKTRSSLAFGYPKEAVNIRKQNKIKNIALAYLKYNRLLETNIRFDVLEIIGNIQDYNINHIKNAF